MVRERNENGAVSTLNGSLTNVSTSIVVTNGGVFSSQPQFRIIIGSEIMLVTAVAGNTLTATRGQEGTVAVAHTDGATVAQIVTRDGLQNYIITNGLPMFGATARPATVFEDINGNVLNAASFTPYNIGGGSITDYTGSTGIGMNIPASGSNSLRVWATAAPSPPWKLSVWIGALGKSAGVTQILIGAKETGAGGSLSGLAMRFDGFVHQAWTSPTVFGAASSSTTAGGEPFGFWMQVEDDNVNLTFRAGIDGVLYRQIHQETRLNTLSSIDQLFFGGNDASSDFGALASIYSWVEE